MLGDLKSVPAFENPCLSFSSNFSAVLCRQHDTVARVHLGLQCRLAKVALQIPRDLLLVLVVDGDYGSAQLDCRLVVE